MRSLYTKLLPIALTFSGAVFVYTIVVTPMLAQVDLSGAEEIKVALDKLNVLGSVLMIAAHPDDENTSVLAYYARGRKVETAYLSATRGEGGQNLIGSEQGDLLGLIRTQELLAARRIDGAQQFFPAPSISDSPKRLMRRCRSGDTRWSCRTWSGSFENTSRT